MQNLLIIGGGPAGYEGAIRAAQLGIKVTLIEKSRLGGTCLNLGCVPTKCLLSDVSKGRDLNEAYQRKNQVVDKLVKGIEQLFKAHKINLIQGYASFVNGNTVLIKETGEKIKFDTAILATGSVPFIPKSLFIDAFTVDSDYLLTNTDLIDKKVAIIGGGVIGIEVSYILGPENVTIIEKLPQILPTEDIDMVRSIERELKKRGAKIYTNNGVSKIEQGKITLENGEVIEAEKAIVVIGRKANTNGLELEKAGINLNEQGFVKVDKSFKTSNPNIYALGDIVGQTMLAHYASASAKNIVANLASQFDKNNVLKNSKITKHSNSLDTNIYLKHLINLSVVPAVIYSTPELARVGKTEKELKQNGIEYKMGKFMYGANARALASEELGTVKILADLNHKILGASILGHDAENMISILAVVMANNGTIHDINKTIFPHPTLGEIVLEASEDVEGLAIHKIGPLKKN